MTETPSDLHAATNTALAPPSRSQQQASAHFADAAAVANYAEGPPRLVPGLAALHRMALILLAERAPRDAQVAGWS